MTPFAYLLSIYMLSPGRTGNANHICSHQFDVQYITKAWATSNRLSFMGVVHIFADKVERYKIGKDPTPLRRWAGLWSSIVVGPRFIEGPRVCPCHAKR
jgi:hypothetical protein